MYYDTSLLKNDKTYLFIVSNRRRLTKKDFILNHRKLWFNIARCILNNKKIVNIDIKKYEYAPKTYNNCWLCDYVKRYHMGNCLRCPLNTSKTIFSCLDGLYIKVVRAYDYKQQFVLAIKIAILPEVR